MVITAIKEGRFSFAPYTPTYIHKPKKEKTRDFLIKKFTSLSKEGYTKVIACEIVNGTTAYLAVEEVKIQNGSYQRRVYPLICSLYYQKGYYNFAVEAMTEEEGPYLYEAPAKILQLLTPPSSQQGQRWREKCWENIKKKTERNPKTQGANKSI